MRFQNCIFYIWVYQFQFVLRPRWQTTWTNLLHSVSSFRQLSDPALTWCIFLLKFSWIYCQRTKGLMNHIFMLTRDNFSCKCQKHIYSLEIIFIYIDIYYTYNHTYICMCIHIFMHAYIHTHIYTYVHTSKYMYIFVYICINIFICVFVCLDI